MIFPSDAHRPNKVARADERTRCHYSILIPLLGVQSPLSHDRYVIWMPRSNIYGRFTVACHNMLPIGQYHCLKQGRILRHFAN